MVAVFLIPCLFFTFIIIMFDIFWLLNEDPAQALRSTWHTPQLNGAQWRRHRHRNNIKYSVHFQNKTICIDTRSYFTSQNQQNVTMCEAGPKVNRSEVFRGHLAPWMKRTYITTKAQTLGAIEWGTEEKNYSEAILQCKHDQWNNKWTDDVQLFSASLYIFFHPINDIVSTPDTCCTGIITDK